MARLRKGVSIEDTDIEFPLTTMTTLHTTWIIEPYNELSSEKEKSNS